jgi:diguanylate cyclase (GGDEF)-like protein
MRLLETVSRIAADAVQKSLKHHEAETYALTDPMTGLPNSRSLQIQFDKEVTRAERSSTCFQLLVLDLDGFKAVNDNFGHKVGDRMLKEVSSVISRQLREYDFLARYGGDEFVAIIPETDNAHVMGLCRRIEAAVNEFRLPVDGERYAKVGVSLGSASYPLHGESFDQLVIAADKAMYITKAINKQRMHQAAIAEEMAEANSASKPNTPDKVDELATSIDEDELNDFLANRCDDDGLVRAKEQSAAIEDILIVELDETHIIASAAIN